MKNGMTRYSVYFFLLALLSALPLGDAFAKTFQYNFNCPCVPVESSEYKGKMCKCDKHIRVTPRANASHGDTYILRCTGPTALSFPAHVENTPGRTVVKPKKKSFNRGCNIVGSDVLGAQLLDCVAGPKRWGATDLSFNLELWCQAP